LDEEFRAALSERTGGHALFTVELLRAMQERGELVRNAGGRWVTGPALDWERLPVRMEAVIQERIERLDEEQRDILAVASVEGEVFTAQAVARVQRLPERMVLRALSQELGPKGHRLVSEFEEVTLDRHYATRFHFAHALFQEHLYRCLSSGERRLLHGEVGEALESLYEGRADEIAPALSHHFQTAGHIAKAAAYALRAGELADYACAFAEAIEHCDTALDLHRELGDRAGEAAVLRTLAGVYFLSGKDDNACQEYGQEALRIFRELGDRDGEASSLRLAGFGSIYRTDIARAESSFQRALAIHGETGELRGRAWALCGLARLYHECTSNFERSRVCAEEAKRLGRELNDPLLESWAGFEFGAALHFEGDYATAGPYLERGVQVYREYGWLMHMAGCLIHVGLNAIALGDYDAALAHLEQSRSTYRELGMGERGGDPARAEATLALLYHQLGENQVAQDLALRSIDCLKSGYHTCLATALTQSGHASVALGQLDGAAAAYEEALELRRDLDQSHLATEPQAGLARIALARGDHAAALAHVEDILGHLKTGSINGTNEPLRIYLTCYRVLQANHDPRADQILSAAHDLLQERASKIDDQKLRRSYLENVAAHREIVEEYIRCSDLV
jgi:tetratricopeptide (TPR) repeat protein